MALSDEANKHVSKSLDHRHPFLKFEPAGHEASSFVAVQTAVESRNTAHPVNALKAVERSQRASPNAGDADTEAHENSIDETRIQKESDGSIELSRHTKPPNLNGTFIVNTHATESW